MAFSSGTYTLPGPALSTGDTVSATENNTLRNDMASSFNLTWLRNGTAAATADIPMGGYKITGLAAATSTGDALAYGRAATVTDLTTTGNTILGDASTDTLNVGNGGLIKDASGNVGVGVTPSAWGTFKAIEMNGGSLGSYTGNNLQITLSQNAYYNGTNYIYKNTQVASRYAQDTGAHIWYNAASGTAGNAITFTQAMTLDASGNLLVGSTSNPNTARMYVRYDGVTTQPVINSASTTSASTSWNHFLGQSGNGSSITTNNIFILGNGNVQNTNNSYGPISDIKVKENIKDATPKLEKLMQVRVVNYNLKGELGYETHTQIGVIAQELEQVFPGLVHETADKDMEGNDLGTTTKGVKMSVFVPMLIKAIQEMKSIIDDQATRIAVLEAK